MKLLQGYKAIALIEMLVCLCFFLNVGGEVYGAFFNVINFFGAGILFFASFFAYFDSKKWMLWLMSGTMLCLIIFNSIWFACHGMFLATGFPLIAYDTLFVIVNFHFLGKGL